MADRQPGVVDAHQVQDRRVQVVAVRLALGRPPAPLVARPVGHPALHTRPGEPRHRGAGVVVAAGRPLRERLPAELRAPDHERVRQQPAVVQVLQQRRGRAVHLAGDRGQFLDDVGVVVPVVRRPAGPAPDLHEPHTTLQQPTRQQAPPAEVGGHRVVGAVELVGRGRLALQVECLRGVLLHPRRQLVALDPRFQPGVAGPDGRVGAVQPAEQLLRVAVGVGGDEARLGRGGEVGDGRAADGVEDRALVGDGQEPGGEVPLLVVRQAAGVRQDDERRQVVREPAEAVGEPCPEAREPGQHEPGVHHVAGRAVHVRLRRDRHQERHPVHVPGEVREDGTHPPPALPVLLERERALHQVAGRAGDALDLLAGARLEGLAVVLLQLRLVVERVRLADAAVQEQLHDAADLRRVVQPAVELRPRSGRVGEQPVAAEEPREGDAAESAAGVPQPLPPVHDDTHRRARVL